MGSCLALKCATNNVGENIMLRKSALLVAAIALTTFAAAPSDSFAASKKKPEQSSSLKDPSQCAGGACTAVNPDRDPNTSLRSQYYRRSHKKHHS